MFGYIRQLHVDRTHQSHLCMYVCMYVNMYVCMYARMCLCMHVSIRHTKTKLSGWNNHIQAHTHILVITCLMYYTEILKDPLSSGTMPYQLSIHSFYHVLNVLDWNCSRSLHRHTAILIVIDRHFQAFQRVFSSKQVLKTVESRFADLHRYENDSIN
jgi:hypothetical protein